MSLSSIRGLVNTIVKGYALLEKHINNGNEVTPFVFNYTINRQDDTQSLVIEHTSAQQDAVAIFNAIKDRPGCYDILVDNLTYPNASFMLSIVSVEDIVHTPYLSANKIAGSVLGVNTLENGDRVDANWKLTNLTRDASKELRDILHIRLYVGSTRYIDNDPVTSPNNFTKETKYTELKIPRDGLEPLMSVSSNTDNSEFISLLFKHTTKLVNDVILAAGHQPGVDRIRIETCSLFHLTDLVEEYTFCSDGSLLSATSAIAPRLRAKAIASRKFVPGVPRAHLPVFAAK